MRLSVCLPVCVHFFNLARCEQTYVPIPRLMPIPSPDDDKDGEEVRDRTGSDGDDVIEEDDIDDDDDDDDEDASEGAPAYEALRIGRDAIGDT